jgi:N-acetylmuramoyl-L-alanine amidase
LLRKAYGYLMILVMTFSISPVLGHIVTNIRASQDQHEMRLVFDLSQQMDYSVSMDKRILTMIIPKIHSHQITASQLRQLQDQYHEFIDTIRFKTDKNRLVITLACKPYVMLDHHSHLQKDSKLNKPARIILDFSRNPPVKNRKKTHTADPLESWDSHITHILSQTKPLPAAHTHPRAPSHPNTTAVTHEEALQNKSSYDLSLPKEKPLHRGVPSKVKPLVVIDPGHGGEDPGAISSTGIHEKNVTIAIARKLQQALLKTGRLKVNLTRTTDVFIPLAKRLDYAKKQQADLFISLHADSHPNPKMQGLSVYTLSKTASDKEAENLARRENSVDQIKGIKLHHENAEVANILIDLTQRETSNRSKLYAKTLIQIIRNKKHHNLIPKPNRAGAFVVLKAQDIPSALVEMGYLSNPTDVKRLSHPQTQNEIALELAQSIQTYFDRIP